MGIGYANDTDGRTDHVNYSGWRHKLRPIWPADIVQNGTNSTTGQQDVPEDGEGTVSVPKREIQSTVINVEVIQAIRDKAQAIANHFTTKTAGSMSEVPSGEGEYIENEDNASSGATDTAGAGILDSILKMGGANISAPAEGSQITKATWESAIDEVEKLAVYSDYSNHTNSPGYSDYQVYYTNHSNSGHTRYNNHTNHGGWWCCYTQNTGHSRYNDHSNSGNGSTGYLNYTKQYSNTVVDYGNYSKVVDI